MPCRVRRADDVRLPFPDRRRAVPAFAAGAPLAKPFPTGYNDAKRHPMAFIAQGEPMSRIRAVLPTGHLWCAPVMPGLRETGA